MEINRAPYQTLLRVPGIGTKSAQRIVQARKFGNLGFEDLKMIGVVLKRALYFITCSGRMMYPVKIEEDYILRNLLSVKERLPYDLNHYQQINLFDDCGGGPMTVFICDNSTDGIFSGVYDAWDSRVGHDQVRLEVGEGMNFQLFADYREIPVDSIKSGKKVARTVRTRMGRRTTIISTMQPSQRRRKKRTVSTTP